MTAKKSGIKPSKIIFALMGLGILTLIGMSFQEKPVLVDVAEVQSGPLSEYISDDGMTRVRELYEVSAPIGGRLLRIEGEVGDPVVAGETLLATLLPTGPGFLDDRVREQAEAAVQAAEAALSVAQADVERAEAEVEFASSEIRRVQSLVDTKTASPAMLDRAKLAFKTSRAALATANSAARMRRADLDVAKAALIGPESGEENGSALVKIIAPISGRIFKLLHESEGVVVPGTRLLELGNPAEIEIVADFLSRQAVKVKAGDPVIIDGWGGVPLNGFVRLVEPKGFTKFSALGIEEQRVNIIIDFAEDNDPDLMERLGHGFRVEPKIVTWQSDSVLQIPTGALFRTSEGWSVFRMVDDRAVLTRVSVGHVNENAVEIVSGLSAGDIVVLHPSDELQDGMGLELRD